MTVAGTLTADPELRFTNNGIAVANFTVAANDRRFDPQSGRWTDGDATFLRCTLWRDAAEHVANSLNRGHRVLVTGVLKQRSFETREGDKRTVLEVDVTEVGVTEVGVTEVGASLKWATVKVSKATRSNGATGDTAPTPAEPAAAGQAAEPPF